MKRRPPQMKARNALAVFGSLAIAASLALEWVSKDVKILALGLALILAGFLALIDRKSTRLNSSH